MIDRRAVLAGTGALVAATVSPTCAVADTALTFDRPNDAELWRELDGLIAAAGRMKADLFLVAKAADPLLRSCHLFNVRCDMTALRGYAEMTVATVYGGEGLLV